MKSKEITRNSSKQVKLREDTTVTVYLTHVSSTRTHTFLIIISKFFLFDFLSLISVGHFPPLATPLLSFPPSFQPSFTMGWCVFSRTFPIIVLQFAALCLYISCPVLVLACTHSSYGHLAARTASQHFLVWCCSTGPGLLTHWAPCPGNLPD